MSDTPLRVYLIDGSGFIFRAFHALPPLTRKSDGLPIGAVSGFCNMLWKLLVDMKAQPDAPTPKNLSPFRLYLSMYRNFIVIFVASERSRN